MIKAFKYIMRVVIAVVLLSAFSLVGYLYGFNHGYNKGAHDGGTTVAESVIQICNTTHKIPVGYWCAPVAEL